eukprot:gb/GECG01001528.1/.p1 GENE.gb/GECG01001528.1/~~gb/GECG01001528.1/.p1  ORF type:complete len:138 (+),score=18.31 gb/GECG01001528.1/:1-414(+)
MVHEVSENPFFHKWSLQEFQSLQNFVFSVEQLGRNSPQRDLGRHLVRKLVYRPSRIGQAHVPYKAALNSAKTPFEGKASSFNEAVKASKKLISSCIALSEESTDALLAAATAMVAMMAYSTTTRIRAHICTGTGLIS